MTDQTHTLSAGAIRASRSICAALRIDPSPEEGWADEFASIIDRETAAPDLLAALRRIAALPAHPKNIRAIDIARAAIAKARGSR